MTHIFISYARADAAAAAVFARAFEAAGIKVWWDAEIRAGESWDLKIEAALKAARAVIVLWSEHSVGSRWVRAEATLAERRRTLLPVRIGPCELPLLFELYQTAELSGWQGDSNHPSWQGLLSDIRRLMADAGVETSGDGGLVGANASALASPRRARMTNLPQRLAPLYGRHKDLAALAAAVASHRLVTILGTGGLGKSRLAEALGAERRDMYPDGVWWIDLAPLKEAGRIASSIARVVGLAPGLERDDLAAELADRNLLIILDNCEHLIDGVAEIATSLLHHTQETRLVATSQEPLKLAEEFIYRLMPLGLATEGGGTEVRAGAISLFEARAKAAEPSFAISADNLTLVTEICRKLDGLPLAIELAAARLPLLGLKGIDDRLSDRFQLLSSNRRGAPERQQTLRAALAWSVSLLSPAEQNCFARLGVFTGRFDLDAAEWIIPESLAEKPQILEHLSALSDKSLLTTEPGQLPRYRLLETPRAFAKERLDAEAGAAKIYRRHAEYMNHISRSAAESKWSDDHGGALPRAVLFLDNIRAALAWAAGPSGDPETLLELTASAAAIARDIGNDSEAHEWCERAVSKLGPSTPPQQEAALLHAYAQLGNQHNAETELKSLLRAADLYRRAGRRRDLYEVLGLLAKKHVWQRDFDAVERALSETEAIFEPGWPPALKAPLLQARTYMVELQGRPEAGEPLMHELIAIMRALNNPEQLDHALLDLAESYIVQGKLREAVAVHRDVRDRRAGRYAPPSAINCGNLMAALAQLGEVDEALGMAQIALPLLKKARKLIAFLDHLALLALRAGRPENAALLAGRADANVKASGFDREVSEERARRLTGEGVAAALPAETAIRLMQQGAAMSDEAALAATGFG